jgi:hypothetical protein
LASPPIKRELPDGVVEEAFVVVHDLAAPLHSIIGILSLLEERSHAEPETSWINIGMQAAKRQRDLIAEILDIFSAENGALGQRTTTAVALADVLERVAAERDPIARSRNLKLRIDTNAKLSPRVVADETRLFRVLTNLVDNAFRYSPPGAAVRVGLEPQEATVTVSVEDEGPGVKPEVLPRLSPRSWTSRASSIGSRRSFGGRPETSQKRRHVRARDGSRILRSRRVWGLGRRRDDFEDDRVALSHSRPLRAAGDCRAEAAGRPRASRQRRSGSAFRRDAGTARAPGQHRIRARRAAGFARPPQRRPPWAWIAIAVGAGMTAGALLENLLAR